MRLKKKLRTYYERAFHKRKDLFAEANCPAPKSTRFWGSNIDGSPYVIGMTIAELRKGLNRFSDTDEVCITVCSKKYWNGGGLLGKLRAIKRGSEGQIWLKARVLDESLE